jgi:hypothetical protein
MAKFNYVLYKFEFNLIYYVKKVEVLTQSYLLKVD